MKIIKKLWNASPASIYTALQKRFIYGNDYNYSVKSILSNNKYMNPSMLIDRWERYNRVINENLNINFPEIKGKHIFELGCGPLLGWGPILLFLGAKSFCFYEPNFQLETIKSKEVKEKYYLLLYNELAGNYGKLMSFDTFYNLIINKTYQVNFDNEDSIDFILSNSVLEHIPSSEIEDTLCKSRYILKPQGKFLHAVDHSPHNPFDSTLMGFYKYSINKKYHALNLLRRNDILEILSNSGFLDFKDYVYRKEEIEKEEVHKSWKKYTKVDLEAKVVFYTSK